MHPEVADDCLGSQPSDLQVVYPDLDGIGRRSGADVLNVNEVRSVSHLWLTACGVEHQPAMSLHVLFLPT